MGQNLISSYFQSCVLYCHNFEVYNLKKDFLRFKVNVTNKKVVLFNFLFDKLTFCTSIEAPRDFMFWGILHQLEMFESQPKIIWERSPVEKKCLPFLLNLFFLMLSKTLYVIGEIASTLLCQVKTY